MKNSIISVTLFLLLCGFIFYADNNIVGMLTMIRDSCNEIEELMDYGEYESASKRAEELYQEIQVKNIMSAIYLNHSEYDYLSDESTRLYVYLSTNEIPDATSALKLLHCNTENLIDLQKFNIKNIF